MASQFYNRLVGVTILVASVVIFLPAIIDGKKTAYEDEFAATAIKPALREHQGVNQVSGSEASQASSKQATAAEIAEVDNSQWQIETVSASAENNSDADKNIEQLQTETKQVETDVVEKKVAVSEKAWTIQLGAFQNAQNINLLLKKLHKAGFQAHTVPTEVIEGQLTRVFVGPNVSKKTLEKQLPQLKRLTQLQGKLIPFNAVSP